MNKKNKGFTLLELLVVIVIIGLVSTITLTFIYMSKNRAKKSRIVSNLDQVRKTAELFYNGNNYSYMGLSDAPDILILREDVVKQGGQLNIYPSVDSYVAYSAYPGAENNHYWCTDSQGNSKDVTGYPSGSCNSTGACPPGQTNPYGQYRFRSGCVRVSGCGTSTCSLPY